MAEPFLGEIRIFAGNFVPKGWAQCDGQLLGISEHEALFGVLGATYGGDGQTTFALPDLRGRVPIHRGEGLPPGSRRGVESVSLTPDQIPSHTHDLVAGAQAGSTGQPQGKVLAGSRFSSYASPNATIAMSSESIASSGGGLPHSNLQPSACLNYIIALKGIVPSEAEATHTLEPILGEVRAFAGGDTSHQWALCNAQELLISEYRTLFSILGTVYGGDGQARFAVPNLLGRAIMHAGSGPGLTPRMLGETLGAEAVTLDEAQMPAHTHTLRGSSRLADARLPAGNLPAMTGRATRYYAESGARVPMASAALSRTPGGAPHNNMQPFLVLNFMIAIEGMTPSRS
jgi:microcystin-dependent protein